MEVTAGGNTDHCAVTSLPPGKEELKDRCEEFRNKIKQHVAVRNATISVVVHYQGRIMEKTYFKSIRTVFKAKPENSVIIGSIRTDPFNRIYYHHKSPAKNSDSKFC
jgi:hypothetical protein